jgi:hypothetical protein
MMYLWQAAAAAEPPMTLSNVFLGLNTLTSLAIVWGGGRLLGKMETQLKNHDDLFERFLGLINGIEQRVGHLEGRK